MAKDKKSFILYADLIHTVEKLPPKKAGELFLHILEYVNDRNPETDDLVLSVSFEPIKQQLKRDLITYEKKRKQWSDAGKASAEARKKSLKETEHTLTDVKSRSTDSTVTVNDTVNVNVNDNKNIPTFKDFKDYAITKKSNVNIESLQLKYDSWVENNWKDGNNKKIINWKTKLLNTLQYLKESTKKPHEINPDMENNPNKMDW